MAYLQYSEASCPVPADLLGQLYRANPETAAEMVDELPESRRIELALFCYSRAHLRPLGLAIAGTCDPARLVRNAGTLGQVLAAHWRGFIDPRAKARVTLAGTRH
jgi:hypothetical protein